jgi:hypothetical protein
MLIHNNTNIINFDPKNTNKVGILHDTVRPLKAHIVAINRERLTAGRKVEAVCHTIGSVKI